MKRFFFVDWTLVHSTPLQHTYRCGWQDLVKWRVAIALNALVLIVLVYYLAGRSSASQPVPETQQSDSPNVTPTNRPVADMERELRDDIGEERFAEYLAKKSARLQENEEKTRSLDRTAGLVANIGGVFYWAAIGSLGAFALLLPLSSFWRKITIEWDGKSRLMVRTFNLWPARVSWQRDEIGGLVFGIREHIERPTRSPPVHQGWFWFIQLTGQTVGGTTQSRVLAEFLAGHQEDEPTTERALVPHRVMELLKWLENCTGHRAHGPIRRRRRS